MPEFEIMASDPKVAARLADALSKKTGVPFTPHIPDRVVLWGHWDAQGTGDWHGGDGVTAKPLPDDCHCLAP